MLQRSKTLAALVFSLLLTLTAFSQANTFTARVVGIVDGDTVTVVDGSGRQIQVRLAGIDAPEKAQDFGDASKQNLVALIMGKRVQIEGTKYDKYGRLIAKILLGGRDINLEQVRAGFAWHYKQYEKEQSASDRDAYAAAELAARASGRGLWSQASPVAPWDFRHHKEQDGATVIVQPWPSIEQITIEVPASMQSEGAVDSSSVYVGGSSNKTVPVRGYDRSNGTHVGPYTRSAPGSRH